MTAAAAAVAAGAPARAAEPTAAAPPPATQVTHLSLPFDGIWGVIQGFDSGDSHVGYAAFALDFVPAQRAGTRPPPRGAPLARFACYGRPVLAPADGRVVMVARRARDWPAYVKGKDEGNFVILEHAPGEYTEFRHLQAGSVRLALGAQVHRGQPIGRCGNSGNATTPHLHVGFLSSIRPITTRPMVISDYEVLGSDGGWIKGDGALREGDLVRPVAPQARHP
jgi:murein DD-endopeptidase MepM/ murein hydrolase activator NlpD